MKLHDNPFRCTGLPDDVLPDVPFPSASATRVQAMLARCPAAAETPLETSSQLANACGIRKLWIKDERGRMGLGSFKALGAAYVIACDAEDGRAKGSTYVTASAGNHGLSVAAGATTFGARAQIFLSSQVPEAFAERLRALGADVVRVGETYEASMEAARDAGTKDGAILLSDSSWAGYIKRPHLLMEGYTALMDETVVQIPEIPDHVFLQAGVGGLAGAAAAVVRDRWGDAPRITIVEPEVAPALTASIQAGRFVVCEGPVSAMGRLDCKEPSLIALKGLARDADAFATISEAEGHAGAELAASHGLPSTPSGAAGLAALAASQIDPTESVLVILSEGPE